MGIKNNILQTVHHLRTSGHFVLYTSTPKISNDDLTDLSDFLESEYENEVLNYPYEVPPFHKESAIWAAKTIYYAVQFLVHRKRVPKDLEEYFPEFKEEVTPSIVLSVDLSLRFLPDIMREIHDIDFEDWLLKRLTKNVGRFQYSTIGFPIDIEVNEMELLKLFKNECFKTLYTDRVIERKELSLVKHTIIQENVAIHLGEYKDFFWREHVS
ncbi:MAG: hypothetical protein JXR05_01985 [Flavobacteriaceae bacterium]